MLKLLIFDLDGTLIDSKNDIANALNWALVNNGEAALSHDLIHEYAGAGIQPLIRKNYASDRPLLAENIIRDFKKYYSDNLIVHTRLFPQAVETLEHFSDWQKVILTNKTNEFIPPILDHFGLNHFFKSVYGRNSFPTRKPDPAPILAIAEEYQLNTNQILIIGDTDADILAGHNAGTNTCAALYGYGVKQELLRMGPTYTIESLNDLCDLL